MNPNQLKYTVDFSVKSVSIVTVSISQRYICINKIHL